MILPGSMTPGQRITMAPSLLTPIRQRWRGPRGAWRNGSSRSGDASRGHAEQALGDDIPRDLGCRPDAGGLAHQEVHARLGGRAVLRLVPGGADVAGEFEGDAGAPGT